MGKALKTANIPNIANKKGEITRYGKLPGGVSIPGEQQKETGNPPTSNIMPECLFISSQYHVDTEMRRMIETILSEYMNVHSIGRWEDHLSVGRKEISEFDAIIMAHPVEQGGMLHTDGIPRIESLQGTNAILICRQGEAPKNAPKGIPSFIHKPGEAGILLGGIKAYLKSKGFARLLTPGSIERYGIIVLDERRAEARATATTITQTAVPPADTATRAPQRDAAKDAKWKAAMRQIFPGIR